MLIKRMTTSMLKSSWGSLSFCFLTFHSPRRTFIRCVWVLKPFKINRFQPLSNLIRKMCRTRSTYRSIPRWSQREGKSTSRQSRLTSFWQWWLQFFWLALCRLVDAAQQHYCCNRAHHKDTNSFLTRWDSSFSTCHWSCFQIAIVTVVVIGWCCDWFARVPLLQWTLDTFHDLPGSGKQRHLLLISCLFLSTIIL